MAEVDAVGARIWVPYHSFLFSDVLIDPQRTSFGDENSDRLAQAGPPPRLLGRLPYWEQKSEREKEREGRGREAEGELRKEKRQDLAQHSQISFFCLLSRLELQERKPSWGTENSELLGVQT